MSCADEAKEVSVVKTMSDQELFRLTRQSEKLRNPKHLRRANTKTGEPRAPEWAMHEQALLGTMPDAEVAKRIGRTLVAVGVRRRRTGIPNYRPVKRWTPEEDKLLGTMPDRLLARKLQRTIIAVTGRRYQLHVPGITEENHHWRPEDDALLGRRPDGQIAQLLGISEQAVKHRRFRLRILFRSFGTRMF